MMQTIGDESARHRENSETYHAGDLTNIKNVLEMLESGPEIYEILKKDIWDERALMDMSIEQLKERV